LAFRSRLTWRRRLIQDRSAADGLGPKVLASNAPATKLKGEQSERCSSHTN